jgi:HK97 gp10 family phage protein
MFTARFEGGEELAAILASLSPRVGTKVLREALFDGGEPMRAGAARRAPREPGAPDMADHLAMAALRDRENMATIGIGPDDKAFFYDLFQELGTVRHGAQPFYRPAFDENIENSLGIIGRELWRALTARGFGVRTASAPAPVSSGGIGGRAAFSGSGL